ncbi:hypothetical protein HY839_02690 [Candidatus Azambacteria bacterium]|nr:hypothetical protein [Candidatus Azambacteria bacterium]
MESQEQAQQNKKRVPKALKIAGIAIGALAVFLITAFYGLSWYGEWSLRQDVARIIEQQNRPYLEDTYGGKTPKETLELFIAAVEKEDFTLASKYFVLSKQREWESGLGKIKERNNLNLLLEKMYKMEDRGFLGPDSFQMAAKDEKGVFMTFISFIKYPSGIWKIQEL